MANGADRKFNLEMLKFFGAKQGAFSPVTDREALDGQITLTGEEKRIANEIFGKGTLEKFRGARYSIPSAVLNNRPAFKLYPSGKIVRPILNLPKNSGSELRMYFNEDDFKVEPGRNWGIFERDGEAWLCHFSDDLKGVAKAVETKEEKRLDLLEDEEDDYQAESNRQIPAQNQTTSKRWGRDPAVARSALEKANFVCEMFPSHPTFAGATTGRAFMEAHHLIPMKIQSNVEMSLDHTENICCLNPWTHRLVHHGEFKLFEAELARLVKARRKFIEATGLIEDDVMAIYAN